MSIELAQGGISEPAKEHGGWRDYLALARLDHSTKHVFVVPGIVLALVLRGVHTAHPLGQIVLGFLTVVCIASANYVINEWLDRDFDRHHPTKSQRSAVQRELKGEYIWAEWLMFVVVGLGCALAASYTMFAVACIFALQGIVYNVPPLRSKNKAYIDVISESINNPLRLMIGWSMIDPTTLPPSSIILAYWLGGAFLMAAKRMSEYRQITASHGRDLLTRYRASFAGYTEVTLTASCLLYALLASFSLAVFLVKYRIEYLVLCPILALLFTYYLALAMKPDSSAQKPEKLFRERGLIVLMSLLGALFLLATLVDIPQLQALTEQHFIELGSHGG